MESKIVASSASPHLAWGSGTLNVELFWQTITKTVPTPSIELFTLFGRLFLRLISRLWLFCCERKTLFYG
jgi:hypothetical protein